MSQRVGLSDGEGLLPSLCSDEPRGKNGPSVFASGLRIECAISSALRRAAGLCKTA
jgi:hypothetical protein